MQGNSGVQLKFLCIPGKLVRPQDDGVVSSVRDSDAVVAAPFRVRSTFARSNCPGLKPAATDNKKLYPVISTRSVNHAGLLLEPDKPLIPAHGKKLWAEEV